MKNEYLTNVKQEEIAEGYIYLTNSYNGKRIKTSIENPRLLLGDNYTTDPDELVIVHVEENDDSYGLSDIWVSRTTSSIIATVELW